MRIVCHFSCGAASAVATKLTLSSQCAEEIVICYAETGSEDKDNIRFLSDCERWFGMPVTRLKSAKYKDTWAVWERKKYIAGVAGAPCTKELKVIPRLGFQREGDVHVFGYTADGNDIRRAAALRENWPDLNVRTPLIERGLTKKACLSMIKNAGIAPPITYAMGFPNANCIPCCKAQSPAYWALVRKEYPVQFYRMAALSKSLGAKLARLNGQRVFVDQVPLDFPTTEAIAPECDFLCSLAELEMA